MISLFSDIGSSQLLLDILDNSGSACYAVDSHFNFIFINKKAAELWKKDRKLLLGQNCWTVFPEGVGSESYTKQLQALQLAEACSYETQSPVLDRWIEVNIQPLNTGGLAVFFADITDRKTAEAIIHDSEAKYRGLFESMDQAFCIIDVIFDDTKKPIDYRFIETNPSFEKQSGLVNANGKTVREFDLNLESYWFEFYGRVADTGIPARFIEKAEALNRWFEVYAYRIDDLEKHVGVFFNDITERKHNEEIEERASLAVASAELGTFEVDLSNNEMNVSKRMQEIFDIQVERDRDRFISALHPDDLPTRNQAYLKASVTSLLEYEARVIRKDQSIRWIRVKGRIYFRPDKIPARLLGVVQDITEEKEFSQELQRKVDLRTRELQETHKALLETNNYFQQIINKFDSGFVSLLPVFEENQITDFVFKMTNTAYTKYSGVDPESIKGRKVSSVFPEYYKTDAFIRYVEVYESGISQTWDLHYNVDHLNVFLRINASKTRDELLIDFVDFTQLKNLELELQQKIKALEQSNQNLQDFAYAASHDLKEPTRKIKVFTERLKESLGDNLQPFETFYFERMDLATKRMSGLIDDLLTYSEVSQQNVYLEVIDLNEIIETVLRDLELEIELKKAEINVSKLCKVNGHPRRLQQVFQNLISNALKYSKPDQPPVIQIKYRKIKGKELKLIFNLEQQEMEFHMITVADNGIGFQQQDADRIFNVFTRLHDLGDYKGSGVGLSIVRKVIENLGGYVWAEATPQVGSTFNILLPLI